MRKYCAFPGDRRHWPQLPQNPVMCRSVSSCGVDARAWLSTKSEARRSAFEGRQDIGLITTPDILEYTDHVFGVSPVRADCNSEWRSSVELRPTHKNQVGFVKYDRQSEGGDGLVSVITRPVSAPLSGHL